MERTVSLCMIVKNEQENIIKCLNSVKKIVDEIIVVDIGSNDRTIKIAKEYGASVYNHNWTHDFSKARNESLQYAKGYWILLMDADELLCEEDRLRVKELIKSGDKEFYSFQTNKLLSEEPRKFEVTYNPRLIKNNMGYCFCGRVNEYIINQDLKRFLNEKFENNKVDIKIYNHTGLYKKSQRGTKQREYSEIENLLFEREYEQFIYRAEKICSEDIYFFRICMMKILAYICIGKYAQAQEVLANQMKQIKKDSTKNKEVAVYQQFLNISRGEDATVLSQDAKEKEYTTIIFRVLDLLLENKELDLFKKNLALLNLIEDHKILLYLAQLYYDHGIYEYAEKEIKRSIKIFGEIDEQRCEILLELLRYRR